MAAPDIYLVLQALLSIFGSGLAVFIAFPAIKDLVGGANSDFIRIAAGAFAGSSSAGIVYLYIREKIHTMPLLFKRGHIIVCGLNFRSYLIINDLVRRKIKPVVIESDAKNAYVESCNMMGLIILTGQPSDTHLLKKAGVMNAAYVLSFSDVDEENAEVALNVMRMVPEKTRYALTCVIQIINPQLYGIIRKHAFSARKDSAVRVEFFNQYALGARALLDQYPAFPDEDAQQDRDNPPRPLVFIGVGRLGDSIISRIARTWYLRQKNSGTRLKIVIIDLNADRICAGLLVRYPKISTVSDLVAIPLDVNSAEFKSGEFLANPVLPGGFITYICLDDDSLGLYAALTLHHLTAGKNVSFVVRMDHNTSVAKLIGDEQAGLGSIREIHPVNTVEITADSQLILAGEEEILARAIHENYCKKEQQKGLTKETNRLLVPWDTLGTLTVKNSGIEGQKYRESNRKQANFIWTKLSLVGCDIGPVLDWDATTSFMFTPEEVETLAQLEHDRWMKEKEESGWRYGRERDDKKKIHPSLVSYNQLSESEKEKDRDTINQIPKILSLIDFQIYRR
ncbi:MAG: RyR domain-containing protein [Methanoregula sp.]|nr:RyR domain-containing protein [Methanoregula sp.]